MKLACLIRAGLASRAVLASESALPTATVTEGDLLAKWATIANNASTIDLDWSDDAVSVVSALTSIQEGAHATTSNLSVESAHEQIGDLFADGATSFIDAAKGLVDRGLIPADVLSILNGYADLDRNSIGNPNPVVSQDHHHHHPLYPLKDHDSADAPYSVPEETLREAIHIPQSFSFGKNGRRPVILVPGTASPAGIAFSFNFAKLGQVTEAEAEVVWVNIPQASLADAQVNSEYVAYAINYIAARSAMSKVAVIGWSQGALNTQWALKYWPSTRTVVDDFIAISPVFHGTKLQPLLVRTMGFLFGTPSIWQQGWESNFVRVLRTDGGDSAYVPTTTIFSSWDEIVQPVTESAILSDIRGAGVTNNHIQTICPNQPAGGIYTHEGVLYNALAWALVIDALTHDGPGDADRLDLERVCAQIIPEQFGLGVNDVLGTEGLWLIAVAEVLAYGPKTKGEPLIAGYAGK